jgi:hypothetical protein
MLDRDRDSLALMLCVSRARQIVVQAVLDEIAARVALSCRPTAARTRSPPTTTSAPTAISAVVGSYRLKYIAKYRLGTP